MTALERSNKQQNCTFGILKTGCYRVVAVVESLPFMECYGILLKFCIKMQSESVNLD